MSCHGRDQDLLLLAHGELGGIRRALTEAHARRCPRCQDQKERYLALSGAMATALRGTELAAWRPRAVAAPPARPAAMLRWVALAAILLLTTAAVAALTWGPEFPVGGPSSSPRGEAAGSAACGNCHATLPVGHPRAQWTPTPPVAK
ncbi:MAG TPA: hypothetical protein VFU47_09155 [Armatimonadota bacterium]|nr:hypothetical protein [Armatimonadota bacterium]